MTTTTLAVTADNGSILSVLRILAIYQFGGYTFELHPYFGPCKLKGNLEPATRMGPDFWKMYDAWKLLSKEDQLDTKISR